MLKVTNPWRRAAAAALCGACAVAAFSLGVSRGVSGGLSSTTTAGRPSVTLMREALADAPTPDQNLVVARVGTIEITLGALEKRLAETPRSTLAKLGDSPEAIRRALLDQVLVRDAVFAAEAKAQGIDLRLEVRDRQNGVMRAALIDALRAEGERVTEADVAAYYEANKSKFSAPKRIAIHRILVATEEEASEIIKTVGTSPDPKQWNEVCREKSLDKTTHLRGGNLGLVDEHGSTAQTEHAVDASLFVAADAVKDGEVIQKPVKEGKNFAVVWKRQSMREMARPLELEAPSIRAALTDQALRGGIKSLLEGLRKELLKEHNPELCDMLSVTQDGDVKKAGRPGVLPRAKRPAQPAVNESPSGLR